MDEVSKTWAGLSIALVRVDGEVFKETRTADGLSVEADLVSTIYPTGTKVPDEVMARLSI